eukprot:PITA_25636
MFKDCITVVKSCHACQMFDRKTRIPPTPLHRVVVVGPFTKWCIDFMTCNPTSTEGHGYIIVAADYFTKWVEAMPTLNNSCEIAVLLFFNHVVSRFDVPQAIVTDHGSHFRNHMMVELAARLGLSHDSSTPYYLQANGQVEAINKVLKCMLQRMIGVHKWSWHLILYSALNLEAEARFLELIQLDETHRDAALASEAHKKRVKAQFDKNIKPRVFSEADLVLLYDQESNKLGAGKLQSLWMGPCIVKQVLAKGAYNLVDYDGIPLSQPRNKLYLKRYYA